MLPRTFHDGNPEDRNYVDDLWTWLRDQPQDVWLLWVRNANWDNADRIFAAMVEHPTCDRAVAAWLFWAADPAYYVSNPPAYPDSLVARIAAVAAGGGYATASLHLDRRDVAASRDRFRRATGTAPAPFEVPAVLEGPFGRRRATAPDYDEATRRDLDEVFRALDGRIDPDEATYRARQPQTARAAAVARLRRDVLLLALFAAVAFGLAALLREVTGR